MKLHLKKYNQAPNSTGKFFLDNPSLKKEIFKNEELIFSGWILSEEKVRIFLRFSNDLETEILLNISRPDVLQKMKNISSEEINEKNSRVGFFKKIIIQSEFSLVLDINGVEYLWVEGLFSSENSIREFWKKCTRKEKIESTLINEIIKGVRVNRGFTKEIARRVFGVNSFSSCENFEKSFSEFSEFIFKIRELDNGNFPFILNGVNSQIVGNFLSSGYNYIHLREDGVDYFYIQQIASLDAIYFPLTNDLVVLGYADAAAVIHLLNYVSKRCFSLKPESKKDVGYVVGFTRPYHVLYDQYPVINFLTEYGVISNNRIIFVHEKHNFLSLSENFSCENENIFDNDEYINSWILKKNSFVFKIGFSFHYGMLDAAKLLLVRSIDKKLINKSFEKYKNDSIFSDLKNSDFTLWLGVTGQKRSWLEQIEGYAKIINYVANRYKNPCVIIDGWTSVLRFSAEDSKQTENDMQIFESILKNIKNDVKFINLIGADLSKKIYAASQVDFFVSNALTGSINVARICEKPGVVHYSKTSAEMIQTQHFHPRTFLPDVEMVTDVPDKENQRYDFCSYSINSDVFLDFFKKSLKSAEDKDFSLALSYKDIFI